VIWDAEGENMTSKKEPLKRKIRVWDSSGNHYFTRDDIKSAVGWYKEQLYKKLFYNKNSPSIKLLDEAFEDVIKK
jgi:hypothetical protein